ncbi:MAG: hypothetical protein LBH30_02610 [Prevotellaceae bacterium]|nr:hypothetical protein [Prevotellaceae bacterium]
MRTHKGEITRHCEPRAKRSNLLITGLLRYARNDDMRLVYADIGFHH